MRRKVVVVSILALLLAAGGAGAYVHQQKLRAENSFECLKTAKVGWLTVTADGNTTVHADWKDGRGQIDVKAPKDIDTHTPVSEAEARALAVNLTEPFRQPRHRERSHPLVTIFSTCDGVARSWTSSIPPSAYSAWRAGWLSSSGKASAGGCFELPARYIVGCLLDRAGLNSLDESPEAEDVRQRVKAALPASSAFPPEAGGLPDGDVVE